MNTIAPALLSSPPQALPEAAGTGLGSAAPRAQFAYTNDVLLERKPCAFGTPTGVHALAHAVEIAPPR